MCDEGVVYVCDEGVVYVCDEGVCMCVMKVYVCV